jgi:hypothetical protein
VNLSKAWLLRTSVAAARLEHEGTQRRGWFLDGNYFDIHHMARLQ